MRDDDVLTRCAPRAATGCDGLHNSEALQDLSEDNVRPIEPGAWGHGDEELRVVGVRFVEIGHGEHSSAAVLSHEVLVW